MNTSPYIYPGKTTGSLKKKLDVLKLNVDEHGFLRTSEHLDDSWAWEAKAVFYRIQGLKANIISKKLNQKLKTIQQMYSRSGISRIHVMYRKPTPIKYGDPHRGKDDIDYGEKHSYHGVIDKKDNDINDPYQGKRTIDPPTLSSVKERYGGVREITPLSLTESDKDTRAVISTENLSDYQKSLFVINRRYYLSRRGKVKRRKAEIEAKQREIDQKEYYRGFTRTRTQYVGIPPQKLLNDAMIFNYEQRTGTKLRKKDKEDLIKKYVAGKVDKMGRTI